MVHLKVCCRLICGVYWVSPETDFSKMYESSTDLTKKRKPEIRDSVTRPDDTVISCLRDASKTFGVALRLLLLCEL